MRTQTTRTIGGQVTANGDKVTGGAYTSRKVANGTYQLAFPPDFRLLDATANCQATGAFFANVSQASSAGCTVYIVSGGGALTDASFVFTAIGAGA